MKALAKIAALVIGALLLGTGCLEITSTINVNKDGSGTIEIKQVMTAQALQQMKQMGGQGKTDKEMLVNKEEMEQVGKSLGPDVKLKEIKYIEKEDGSKGSLAIFTFKDISKVKFGQLKSKKGKVSTEGGDDSITYTFNVAKDGDSTVLTIIPKAPEAKTDTEKKKPTEQELAQAMRTMKMMGGLKMQQLVEVNGKIVKTNATHVSKDKDAVCLLYLNMDKLMENEAALKKMLMNQDDFAAMAKIDAKGIKVEDPKKKITIRFK